jgi:hypothetical protein
MMGWPRPCQPAAGQATGPVPACTLPADWQHSNPARERADVCAGRLSPMRSCGPRPAAGPPPHHTPLEAAVRPPPPPPQTPLQLTSPERASFERLLRKLLRYPKQPAVVLLNSVKWFESGWDRAANGELIPRHGLYYGDCEQRSAALAGAPAALGLASCLEIRCKDCLQRRMSLAPRLLHHPTLCLAAILFYWALRPCG